MLQMRDQIIAMTWRTRSGVDRVVLRRKVSSSPNSLRSRQSYQLWIKYGIIGRTCFSWIGPFIGYGSQTFRWSQHFTFVGHLTRDNDTNSFRNLDQCWHNLEQTSDKSRALRPTKTQILPYSSVMSVVFSSNERSWIGSASFYAVQRQSRRFLLHCHCYIGNHVDERVRVLVIYSDPKGRRRTLPASRLIRCWSQHWWTMLLQA